MNPFALANSKRIQAQNKVNHGLTKEERSITLLNQSESGAFDNELASIDKKWFKRRIRDTFQASQTERSNAFVEVFEIAVDAVDSEAMDAVAAVRHGNELYSVVVRMKPTGKQQYWRLQITGVETLNA